MYCIVISTFAYCAVGSQLLFQKFDANMRSVSANIVTFVRVEGLSGSK
jgi:hypothetical protein